MIIHDVEQNTPELATGQNRYADRFEFHTVMASGKGGGPSLTRRTYMMKLAGEIITGEPMENYQNGAMERGKMMEVSAREKYAFDTDADPQLVGFISNHGAGCSPDALVGDRGLLEIKTKAPHLHIEAMFRDDIPPEHRAQCQGQLWVAEREWLDLCIYYPKMPMIIRRVTRDEAYIREIAAAVATFNAELGALVERVRRYRP